MHQGKFSVCHEAEKIARELGYGEKVCERIKAANTDAEITRIMREERLRERDGNQKSIKTCFVYIDKK